MRLEQKQLIMKKLTVLTGSSFSDEEISFKLDGTGSCKTKDVKIKSHWEKYLLTSSSVDLTDSLLARITV